MMQYIYKDAIIWMNSNGFWYADPYPHRLHYVPEDCLGPYTSQEEVEEAVSNTHRS